MFDTVSPPPPIYLLERWNKKPSTSGTDAPRKRKGGAAAADADATAAAFVSFSDDVRRLAAAAGVTERSTRREDDNVLRRVQTEEAKGIATKVNHVATASVVFLNQFASTAWASNKTAWESFYRRLGCVRPLDVTFKPQLGTGNLSIYAWRTTVGYRAPQHRCRMSSAISLVASTSQSRS
ncbi:uncharacterized protein N0V96_004793 [Colletotrichum fioriniae]|uniref:uncharacterized protein n=1 Tax=Colletotrichum fioriniae TaxID=710243 RepID=UPI0032D9B14A|nr:hypothetical protein N0V96_004793 [Colletotrichum fioriniae]